MPHPENNIPWVNTGKQPSEKLFTPRPCKNGGSKEDCDPYQTVIGDPLCDECLEGLQKTLTESALKMAREGSL